MSEMIEAFQSGGVFMYPIAIMMVAVVLITIERVYNIVYKFQANAAGLMQKVQRLILENNIDEAIKICNSKRDAGIYQVFKAALVNADRPFDEIQDHVEVATLAVVPKLQKRMPYLFTIANIATLMGLLGTIIGLIATFKAVGAVEGSQKQQLLSAGISTAMSTTAFGLMVAIPAMTIYGYLFNRINGIVDEIDYYSAKLLTLLKTGSSVYDHFTSEEMMTTEQTPKVKSQEESDNKDAA